MTASELKKSILQMAIEGKLTEQSKKDEPVEKLLKRIKEEKESLIKEGKIKKEKTTSEIYKKDGSYYERIAEGKNILKEVCIDEELPFEIPDSWAWVRLGTLMSLITDGTHKTPKYVDKGIPFLSVQNISKGFFDFTKIKYITKEEHEQLIKRVKPQLNDILLCRVGTLGKALKCTLNIEFSIFVSLGLLRPVNVNIVDFIILLINSPLGDKWIDYYKIGGGTHTYKLNLIDIPKMLFPLPPIEEQKRIAEKINLLMPLINEYDSLEKNITKLNKEFPNSIKKSILQYAIEGKLTEQSEKDEPVEKLLKRIKEEREKLIKEGKIKKDKTTSEIYKKDGSYYERVFEGDNIVKDVCIDDELPFEIPDSWAWIRISNLGFFSSGKTPKEDELSTKGQYPYFKVSDMNTKGNELYLIHTNKFLSKYYNKKLFSKGTIVFPKNGGAVFTNKKRILYQDSLVDLNTGTYTIFSYNYDDYVFYLFKTIDFSKYYKGTALPTIDYELVEKILFPLPPIEEQGRIVDKINRVNEVINTIKI
ncbi:restriction endonuclease subunit S [Brachyspira pilosicoli]|uniref:restriction endonuclease subunit S n=1 Tax=Brachyspira pilosicoli TaxID=52584 RepID=UPI0012F4DC2B|nr:restriction endonuclease subunit S [Brachyspira pilosicoli]